ncbi:MAG: nicotinate-nucleotide--dimethylbenzimidazole phosphoribosyltransferase [Deltaproteobacteria bacterium]|nr:nicotinate-nucleotide--dimethylbenzimidazole phosphoribosyltransferase [Deltaproteobacteria bacterium]
MSDILGDGAFGLQKYAVPELAADRLAEFETLLANKTKPPGSLGVLEDIAKRLCQIQNTVTPRVLLPTIVVFAADHGIAEEGVSAYPQSVTAAMVSNFLRGGAAINVLARESQAELVVVDAGVKTGPVSQHGLISARIGSGTRNFLRGPAMTSDQLEAAMKRGRDVVDEVHERGCNTIGFGEMGIGNTSSAAVMISILCRVPLSQCVGPGTGLAERDRKHKISILESGVAHAPELKTPKAVMAYFGGFELAMMCGAMLRAGELRMAQLVDGFSATAAFLVANSLEPRLVDYSFFSHLSTEPGHELALKHLGVKSLLQLSMRLGEGTGCAVALPVLRMAAALVREMATFDEAKIARAGQV